MIFGDAPLTVACARELLKIAPAYDYLITAEAKGIPLIHEMARQHGDAKYFVARKNPAVHDWGVRVGRRYHHHRQGAAPVARIPPTPS